MQIFNQTFRRVD